MAKRGAAGRIEAAVRHDREYYDKQKERDRKALAAIERLIDSHAFVCNECKKDKQAKDLSPTQAALIKMRYERLRPVLSSVEQTTVHEYEGLDADEIARQVAAMLTSNPAVLVQVLRADDQARVAVLAALHELDTNATQASVSH